MGEIIIRNFSIDDFEDFSILINEVHRLHVECRPDFYRKTNEPISKKDFLSIVNDINTITILAEINYIIVGLCVISIKPISTNISIVPRRVAYMEDLCVSEDYRNQGVGERLFIEGKKRTLEFNVDSLELMV